jgi:hypothetical protein
VRRGIPQADAGALDRLAGPAHRLAPDESPVAERLHRPRRGDRAIGDGRAVWGTWFSQ